MKEGQQRLPDSQQEQGLKSSQPAPATLPSGALNDGSTGSRPESTKNDNG